MNKIAWVDTSGRVYGHHYRVIHFEDYESEEDIRTINLWCWDTFGERGEVYDGPGIPHRWYYQNNNFWIRDEKDYEWFLLRWQ